MSSTTIDSQEDAATNVQIGGNVAGDIIVGNNNLKVNTNYGTIIDYAPHESLIKRLLRRMKKHADARQINREGM